MILTQGTTSPGRVRGTRIPRPGVQRKMSPKAAFYLGFKDKGRLRQSLGAGSRIAIRSLRSLHASGKVRPLR